MKITRSSDWRDAIPFDTPVSAAEHVPGDDAKCVGCPAEAPLHPRTEMMVVKHRHPNNPAGFVRLYCAEHAPKVAAPVMSTAAPGKVRGSAPKAQREAAPKRETLSRPQPNMDITRAMCPDCYVEVAPSGICGMCGEKVS